MAEAEFDVAVVGAGAAGLAAARVLGGAPVRFVLLEARSRVGGRAVTAAPWRDLPLDLGAGWLHSANRNVLAQGFEAAGYPLDKTPPHWTRQAGNQDFSAEAQEAFWRAYSDFEARLDRAAESGRDGPAAAHLSPGCRWNPLLDAVSSYYNGAELDLISVLDYAAYVDTGTNWRAANGYGATLAAYAGAAAALDCAVSRIDHTGAVLRLATPRGEVVARTAIVAVPTTVIAGGGLAFAPDLPAKREAAEALPLGLADKVFIALDEPEELPVEGHLFGHIDRAATGSYHTRPIGRPLIEGYFGGRYAEALEAEGEGALAACAMDELVGLIGSDFRRRAKPIAATRWRSDPWARGSYSHALPYHAGARAALGKPIDERLFFAGEAVSPHFYSTVHGAWETGEAAARAALAAVALS
jgi:monoamine oxidase